MEFIERKDAENATIKPKVKYDSRQIDNESDIHKDIEDYTCPITGMEFVFVKGGCYQMGDTFGDGKEDEKPVHEVCVDDFYIGKDPVTQKQWIKVMGANPSENRNLHSDDAPVNNVSWNDAQEFIRKLNSIIYKKYRLPTEAEWEYAARSGGKNEKWAGTNDVKKVDEYVWHSGIAAGEHPVGQKKPNGLGIYDMCGHIWEWVQDSYSYDAYSEHSRNNPIYECNNDARVTRGGFWGNEIWITRCCVRYKSTQYIGYYSIGFRLALEK